MKKPAIPAVPLDAANKEILSSLKEAVEIITGQRGDKLTAFSGLVTLGDVVSKVNKIIKTLQNVGDSATATTPETAAPQVTQITQVISANYTHTQSTALATWTVNHNLGFKPAVTVLTLGGVEMWAEITHVSNNQVSIGFDSPITGQAILS